MPLGQNNLHFVYIFWNMPSILLILDYHIQFLKHNLEK